MHYALRRLHRTGFGRKADLNLAFELARHDVAAVLAERAREAPLPARAKERHRGRAQPAPRIKATGDIVVADVRSA